MDLLSQQVLRAAAQHDVPQLRILLRSGSASVQDPESGFTPLHTAIAACADPSRGHSRSQADSQSANHTGNGDNTRISHAHGHGGNEGAASVLKLLLENGAIWNDLDKNDETPGCLALRLGLDDLYAIIVDAGVRAELILNRLDEYERLGDESDGNTEAIDRENEAGDAHLDERQEAQGVAETAQDGETIESVTAVTDMSNENYLRSSLHFQEDSIVDDSQNGVMMAWETDIMKHTVELLIPREGLRILNVGHGMGIIDDLFQRKSPSSHQIIEAHPQVLSKMKKDGWYEKPGVIVHEGRWQDIVSQIIEKGSLFDAVYFDTFAEDYKALRDFFSDHLIGLLDDQGKWGFFHGLGGDRQIC